MRRLNLVLIVALGCLLLSPSARAQDPLTVVVVPATKLESLETNIGIVVIRASMDLSRSMQES